MVSEEERLFIPLVYPPASLRLKRIRAKIHVWCVVRRKFLMLTPEEWVRQHIVHYLVYELGYPLGLISLEKGTTYQSMSKRTDILIFDLHGAALLLIECKAPGVQLNSETMHQAAQYNHTLMASYVMISNGLAFQLVFISSDSNTMIVLDNIPNWKTITGES
jgi:hypothetical protein